ncbi:MAG: hypothetical protein LBH55_03225 [Mycoplasmataceae bacterium]|nr:hypothetical protein [Mycoplasmataceae bacterium]
MNATQKNNALESVYFKKVCKTSNKMIGEIKRGDLIYEYTSQTMANHGHVSVFLGWYKNTYDNKQYPVVFEVDLKGAGYSILNNERIKGYKCILIGNFLTPQQTEKFISIQEQEFDKNKKYHIDMMSNSYPLSFSEQISWYCSKIIVRALQEVSIEIKNELDVIFPVNKRFYYPRELVYYYCKKIWNKIPENILAQSKKHQNMYKFLTSKKF